MLSVALLMMAASAALVAWQEKAPAQASSDPYTKWLNEDVAYIIAPAERVAFLELQTDAERIQFIDQFWLRRDPTPGTPQNEMRDEHYRRIAYANNRFTTLAGKAGWKTDRGRIYIQFGAPDELETHPIGDPGVPYEKWRYRYIQNIGNDVLIEFQDRNNDGDFRMTVDPSPPPGRQLRNPQ